MNHGLIKRLRTVLIAIALLVIYVLGYGLLLRVLYGGLAGAYPGLGSR